MCSLPGLEGPGWASGTEQSVTSNDTITIHSQGRSQMVRSFISSSNKVSLGGTLDELRYGRLLQPDKSCFLPVDVGQLDTSVVAKSDTLSVVVQASRSYPGLSLDNGHLDTDNSHVAHTVSLGGSLDESVDSFTPNSIGGERVGPGSFTNDSINRE